MATLFSYIMSFKNVTQCVYILSQIGLLLFSSGLFGVSLKLQNDYLHLYVSKHMYVFKKSYASMSIFFVYVVFVMEITRTYIYIFCVACYFLFVEKWINLVEYFVFMEMSAEFWLVDTFGNGWFKNNIDFYFRSTFSYYYSAIGL